MISFPHVFPACCTLRLTLIAALVTCPLVGVELTANLRLEIAPMEGVLVEYRWLVTEKPMGSGDPLVTPGPASLSGTSSLVSVALPEARPGTYAFQAQVTANGLTVTSSPVTISVVTKQGDLVVQPTPSGDGGSGGGCGVGGGVGLIIALSSLGLYASRHQFRDRNASLAPTSG
jgi:hypothetical protein